MQIDPSQQPAQAPATVPNPPDASTTTQQPQAPQSAATNAPVQNPNPAQQPVQNQPDGPQQRSGAVSNAPDPNLQNHPAVQHASLLRTIAQTLAGGPRIVATPNADGTVTRTVAPLSKADLAMAIIAESLSGAVSGLAQRGPGATGRAAAAGFDAVSQQQQQAQQQQEAQAQQDAQAKSKALVQSATLHELASRTILNTQQAERMGIENLKDAVNESADLLQGYRDQNAVTDQNVTQDALMDGMKSGKYNALKQAAIPDGWTNVNGKWEQTFSVVDNPSTKITLTQDDVDRFSAAHVRGFPPGMKIGAGGYPVPGYIIAQANQQLLANRFMVQEAGDVSSTLSKSDDPAVKALGKNIPDFGKLMDDPQTGLAFQNALPKLQKYLHHDGTGDDFYQALVAMSQPTRPDPTDPKKMISNTGDANAAQIIAGAFGGNDPAQGWKILRAYHDDVTPAPLKSETEAESIISDPASSPREIAHARKFLALSAQQKSTDAAATERAKKATQGTGTSDSARYANEQPINGVRQNYLSSLPPAQAEFVRAIGEGRMELSSNTARTKDGQALMQMVTTAYPGYDFSRASEYAATRKAFTSGKTADAVNALNTAMGHMLVMYQNATLGGSLPIVGGIERAAGNQSAIDLANAKTALVDELGKAYKSGALTDQDVKSWKGRIDAWTPAEIQGNARSFVQLLDSKLSSYEQQWRNGSPPGAVAPIQILSPEARNAYQIITGKQPITGSGLTNIQVNPATHQQIGWDGTQWVDISTRQAVR